MRFLWRRKDGGINKWKIWSMGVEKGKSGRPQFFMNEMGGFRHFCSSFLQKMYLFGAQNGVFPQIFWQNH